MFASIDIGTNSSRLLLSEWKDKKLVALGTYLETTRIGENMGPEKMIKQEALDRTIICLENYKKILEDFSLEKIFIIATSALREAKNQDEVLREIEKRTGLEIEVISGEREAYLSFLGAVSDEPSRDEVWVLDIGGGSSELVYKKNGKLEYKSIDLGAVVLSGQEDKKAFVQEKLQGFLPEGQEPGNLLGVGGTITSLGAMKQGLETYDSKKIHGSLLYLAEIEKIYEKIKDLPLEARYQIKGLDRKRADIIDSGILILLAILEKLGIREIKISDKDLLYGLVIDYLENKE